MILTVFVVVPTGQAFGAASLNGHQVVLDGSGRIIPWTANPGDGYGTVIDNAWNYLLNSVPNDPANGKPAYYSHSYMNPDTQQPVGWPHNPAGLYSMLTESALKYYGYSGNVAPVNLVKDLANWQLRNGMSGPNDNWANVPYSSGDAGSLTYHGAGYGDSTGVGDGTGYLQPDKVGAMGYAWAQLYEFDGTTNFRDAAIAAADALAGHVRTGTATQSPWPFRVNAATGAIREQYTANVIDPIQLFDTLIELNVGNTAAYRAARQTAWNWLMTYPMQNNLWSNYFEDVAVQPDLTNSNQLIPMMTARYLLQHPESDANWLTHVQGLISWVESNFSVTDNGATVIKEQDAFPYPMGSHTSRYASVNALLSAVTGSAVAKEKAFYSLNWATYMARSNGVVIDGPQVNNQWFTDGYADYIRHFLTSMQAFPEWAPGGQTHLTGSTSMVRTISYAADGVQYTTLDPSATDSLRVAFTPASVLVNGAPLTRNGDLNQQGWTYDAITNVLRIRHDNGTSVQVVVGAKTGNQPPTVSLINPPNRATFTAGSDIVLNASASDSDGTVTQVQFYNGSTLLSTSTTTPYSFTWKNVAGGTYDLSAVATDNGGAISSSTHATITVTTSSKLPGPWHDIDIGPVGASGSSSYSGGTYTVTGSGVDIWGNADSFHYVYQPLSGDGQITARVASQSDTHAWALAGVMIRESLDAGAREAIAAVTPGNGLSFTWRPTTDGISSYVAGSAGVAPCWVRLERLGDTVTAYRSSDGAEWSRYGTATIAMGATAYIGLAVTSHDNRVPATDTFDNVTFVSSADTIPPTISDVAAANINQNGANITWTTNEAADSQVDYGTSASYGLSTALNRSLVTSHTTVISGLDPATTYHVRVTSRDAAGNLATSGDYTFDSPAPADATPPSSPTGLTATTVTDNQVTLSWTPSTDNVRVTGYRVYRDGSQVGASTMTGYVDSNLTPGKSYGYTVRAIDAAGNMSADSGPITVTTLAPAIAIDTAVVVKQTAAATSLSAPAMSTAAPNELLIAFIAIDGPAAAQQIDAVSGGGLNWTLQKRVSTQHGASEIWTATAAAVTTDIAVNATHAGSYEGIMEVVAMPNAVVGAAAGASGDTGPPSASLNTSAANSWVWGVGNDWDSATARTVGPGQTKVDEMLSGLADTFWVQRQSGTIETAGSTVGIDDTGPTSDRWNLAIIEIIPR